MDFSELAQSRYSVRKFQKTPVSEEQIRGILEAAQSAPTACNNQPQRVFVVTTPGGREKIRRSTGCHFDAPMFFVVCYDRNESWHRNFDGQDYGMADAAIVLTQMMLKIQESGLGSCFVGWFDPAVLRRELALPEDWVPVGILPCGVPAPDAAPSAMHQNRKPLEQTVIRL